MSIKLSALRVFIAANFAVVPCFHAFSQDIAKKETASKLNLPTQSSSQEIINEIEPLSIGEKMPDLEFTQILNSKNTTVKLSDFKGKIVLIDFWATWCMSCIGTFPKLELLQNEFKDKLQILLVNSEGTGDNKEKIEAFFEKRRNKNGEKFQLPTIAGDVILAKMFPHISIPHYAWIDKDGVVRAITSSKYVTTANIKAIIENGDIALPTKRDLDTKRPLFLSDDLEIEGIMTHSVFLKGRVDNLPSGYRTRKNGDVVVGKAFMNEPILYIYKRIAQGLMNEYNEKKVRIEVNDISKLILDTTKIQKDDWRKENFYTYELILPINESDKLNKYMLEDLNRYSEYHGEIKKVRTKCLVLVRTSQNDKLRSKGGKSEYRLYLKEKPYMKNLPIASMLIKLNSIRDIDLFILDSTNYKENIDIQFENSINSGEELIKQLKRYDLTIVETMKTLDVLVITDKKQKGDNKQSSTK